MINISTAPYIFLDPIAQSRWRDSSFLERIASNAIAQSDSDTFVSPFYTRVLLNIGSIRARVMNQRQQDQSHEPRGVFKFRGSLSIRAVAIFNRFFTLFYLFYSIYEERAPAAAILGMNFL